MKLPPPVPQLAVTFKHGLCPKIDGTLENLLRRVESKAPHYQRQFCPQHLFAEIVQVRLNAALFNSERKCDGISDG